MPEPEQSSRPLQEAPRTRREEDALSRYVAAAVDRECELVATCIRGRRNNQLNDSAFNLGTLVGANVLTADEATRRLYAAAQSCGYVKDKGHSATMATIESGTPARCRAATRPVEGEQSDAAQGGGEAQPASGPAR